MTHPLEQLAQHVDGTLAPAERAARRGSPAILRPLPRARSPRGRRPRRRSDARGAAGPRPRGAVQAPSAWPSSAPRRTAPRSPRSAWTKVAAGARGGRRRGGSSPSSVPRLGTSSERRPAAGAPGRGWTRSSMPEGTVRLELDETDYDAARACRTAADARRLARPQAPPRLQAGGRGARRSDLDRARPTEARFAPGRTDGGRRMPRTGVPRLPGRDRAGESAPRSRARPPTSAFVLERPRGRHAPGHPRRSGSPRSRTARSCRSRPRVSERSSAASTPGMSGMPERSSLWEDSLT